MRARHAHAAPEWELAGRQVEGGCDSGGYHVQGGRKVGALPYIETVTQNIYWYEGVMICPHPAFETVQDPAPIQ